MKYAIVGTGETSEAALQESLRDILTEDDTVLIGWLRPMPEVVEHVYGYLLDNEVQFRLYHRPEQEVTRHFRDAENCVVTQSRHPLDAMLKEADEILFLWNDAEQEANPSLIQYVFDHINDGVRIKELSNGLAPIVIEDDIPEPEPAPSENVEEVDDTRFTRDELEIMTAAAVKRYGDRLGLESKTKSGIIEELFPEAPQEQAVEPQQETESYPITSVLHDFIEHAKPGTNASVASALLDQARLFMLKALAE